MEGQGDEPSGWGKGGGGEELGHLPGFEKDRIPVMALC